MVAPRSRGTAGRPGVAEAMTIVGLTHTQDFAVQKIYSSAHSFFSHLKKIITEILRLVP
jgi:hypothetical protein